MNERENLREFLSTFYNDGFLVVEKQDLDVLTDGLLATGYRKNSLSPMINSETRNSLRSCLEKFHNNGYSVINDDDLDVLTDGLLEAGYQII